MKPWNGAVVRETETAFHLVQNYPEGSLGKTPPCFNQPIQASYPH